MNKKKGSMTVEAAITYPIFIFAILFCIFIGKVIYIESKVQYALDQASSEIATYSYIYYKSGITQYENDNTNYKDFPNSLLNAAQTILFSQKKDFEEKDSLSEEIKKLFFATISKEIKSEIFTPYLKYDIQKYLNLKEYSNESLKSYFNINNGFDGISFKKTSILSKGTGDINIEAEYDVIFPVFNSLIPKIKLISRSIKKPWLGGDNFINNSNDNIWSLPPFERGKKLQIILGENLPDSLPVSIINENGCVTRITSIDITLPYASKYDYIEETIKEHLKILNEFNDISRVNILDPSLQKKISSKILLIVIPEDTITGEINYCFEKLKTSSLQYGIRIEIKPYQKKL